MALWGAHASDYAAPTSPIGGWPRPTDTSLDNITGITAQSTYGTASLQDGLSAQHSVAQSTTNGGVAYSGKLNRTDGDPTF